MIRRNTKTQTAPAALCRFARNEDGAGTVMGLFTAAMVLLIGGLAVDGSNYWRNAQVLQQTADAAAHAGVVRLAHGETEAQARSAAMDIVDTNMPNGQWGNLFADAVNDIEFLSYDPETNSVSNGGDPNAVRVKLSRNDASGNPVRTLILGLSDSLSFGIDTQLSYLDLDVNGTAVVAQTKSCNSTDGIYAKGELRLSSSNSIGRGYCLHSQDHVWLSQQNSFAPTAGLSMPDLDDCKSKCSNNANPGAGDAAFERNYIMPTLADHVNDVRDAFLGSGDITIRDDFFYGKSVEYAATYVFDDAGINYASLSRGAVISLTEAQFEALPDIPRGFTYDVTCTGNGNGGQTRLNLGAQNGGEKGNKKDETEPLLSAGPLDDLAIITNCSLDFGAGAEVNSSVILSTRTASSATITASSGAVIGDSFWGCDIDKRSVILSRGHMHVPADFAGSNVQFIVDGNVHLSAASSSVDIEHSGVGFFASGEIDIASNHTFNSCNLPPSGLVPGLQAIRFVEPAS